VEQGEETAQMRRTRDFKEFLRENYEAGRADIQHPDPQKRRRNPTIKFWTAMKYDTFKKRVKEEFQRWLQEQEAQRPRIQPGARIQNLDELRVGDVIGGSWGTKYKVIRKSPRSVVIKEVDNFGRFKNDREKRRNLNQMLRNRWQRHQDLKRPDVDYDKAKAYIDENHGFPPRDVTNKAKYKEWLKKKFVEGRRSPYRRLGDDEAQHQEALERHLNKILEERNVGDDWSWTPPPPVQVGQRIQHPLQVETGDFVEYYGRKYRILEADEDKIQVVEVDRNGRPRGNSRPFDKRYLKDYQVKRIEPVERPEVSLDQAKTFAAANMLVPPRNINSRTEYKKWLEEGFKEKRNSPYQGLGDDEVEHQRALEKQIKKILEERGIGPGWEWTPPDAPAIGEVYLNKFQARPGHFVKRWDDKYKILEVRDDGTVRGVLVDSNGRPVGEERTLSGMADGSARRIEEVKRPAVSEEKAKQFAEAYAKEPGRSVRDKEQYRKWLKKEFTGNRRSPYYALGDDETEHKQKLEEAIDKILEERSIGDDWKWTPPPLIQFPAQVDWGRHHDAIRRTAQQGEHVRHPDAPRGKKDARLGAQGINQSSRRRMQMPDGSHQDFVFKSARGEEDARTGCPPGTLHLREQAAYNLDRLLGDGVVVPPTISDGTGSYQQFQDGAFMWGRGDRRGIRDDALKRHEQVQRMIVLDVLQGHEDRHSSNMMFSWKNPNGPWTASNAQFHAIDNGYSFGHPDAKSGPWDFVVRHPWSNNVVRSVLEHIPDELHEKLKKVKTRDVIKTLVAGGLKNKSMLQAVAVKLKAMQNDPAVIGKMMRGRRDPKDAQQKFHWQAGREPLKLVSQAELDKILREIEELR